MRGWVCFLALLLAAMAPARPSNPLLILIQPLRAGPNVDIHDYVHDVWVEWGPEDPSPTGNRLLALLSGRYLSGEATDYAFRPVGAGRWRAMNAESLRQRGYLAAKTQRLRRLVTVLSGHDGNVTTSTLALGVRENGEVRVVSPDGKWPGADLLVAEAVSWDEMAALEKRTTGPVMVVEYPVPAGQRWSRVWLRGKAWVDYPEQLPIFDRTGRTPGLIPAHEVGKMLVEPEAVKWETKPDRWTGANRWMEQVRTFGAPVRILWAVVAIALSIWGVRLIADDRDSDLWHLMLPLFALMIPGINLGGRIAMQIGADRAPLAWGIGWFVLFVLWAVVELPRLRRGGDYSWTNLGVVGLLGCFVGTSTFTPFSAQLSGIDHLFSAEVAGAGAFFFGLMCRNEGTRLRGRTVVTTVDSPWLIATLFTPGVLLFSTPHWQWHRTSLLRSLDAAGRWSFDHLVPFFLSPAFLVGLFVMCALTVFAQGYASHRFRRTWPNSVARLCLPYAVVPLVAGLFVEDLLAVGWSVLIGLAFVWIRETLRSA